MMIIMFFFFSSRRRHTRSKRDWSSDVCSSDLPWGDVWEDFLDPIGVSLDGFLDGLTGGWLFGYVEALRSAGVRTVLVCFTARESEPRTTTHRPSGTTVRLLPASPLFRRLRRGVRDPYGRTLQE